jgi:hypothetical protein
MMTDDGEKENRKRWWIFKAFQLSGDTFSSTRKGAEPKNKTAVETENRSTAIERTITYCFTLNVTSVTFAPPGICAPFFYR